VDVGLVLLRIAVGLLFVGHGTQKLFGWFGGGGIRGSQGYFQSMGYPPMMAILAGTAEAGGGTLVALGWFTPLAAAAITVVMVNVIAVKWSHGLWEVHDGFEYPLTVMAVICWPCGTEGGVVSAVHALVEAVSALFAERFPAASFACTSRV